MVLVLEFHKEPHELEVGVGSWYTHHYVVGGGLRVVRLTAPCTEKERIHLANPPSSAIHDSRPLEGIDKYGTARHGGVQEVPEGHPVGKSSWARNAQLLFIQLHSDWPSSCVVAVSQCVCDGFTDDFVRNSRYPDAVNAEHEFLLAVPSMKEVAQSLGRRDEGPAHRLRKNDLAVAQLLKHDLVSRDAARDCPLTTEKEYRSQRWLCRIVGSNEAESAQDLLRRCVGESAIALARCAQSPESLELQRVEVVDVHTPRDDSCVVTALCGQTLREHGVQHEWFALRFTIRLECSTQVLAATRTDGKGRSWHGHHSNRGVFDVHELDIDF